MQIKYTKITSDIIKTNRNFYKNHVKKAFIMWCAYEGLLDTILSKQDLEKAKRGYLPDYLNIHHKIPLSGSNELFVNDFNNLSIIHRNTHEFINKYVYSPQLKQLYNKPFGTEIIIEIPNYDYVDVDGIKKECIIEKEKRINKQEECYYDKRYRFRR